MSASLAPLRDAWKARWPEALALWSRFTRLSEPRWCFDRADEKREELASSFAMIRLADQAVVISLAQVAEHHLEEFPLEVMGHEIGHHVHAPSNLADQARLIARIRRGLPGKEAQAPLVANLYTDLLINDRLQRQAGLKMSEVYRRLSDGAPADRMWTFYTRIYEVLWSLPKGTLATGPVDAALEADAGLGARLVRVYGRDWLKGAGRFAALCFPYLAENDGRGVAKALRGWLDTPGVPAGAVPDGLTEMDDDEEDGAIHPSLDPDITGVEEGALDTEGKKLKGDVAPRRRYREPGEYRDILRSVGVTIPDDELTIRYYRERALPFLVPFPVKEVPGSSDPLPEGLDGWDAGEPMEQLDVMESLLKSETLVPGVTTVQRTWGTSPGSLPEKQPLDFYLGVDCSGSMGNPAQQTSHPVLAGAVIALSALRAGGRVMVVLSGDPGRHTATDGFVRDEHEVLKVLTGYLGTGYAFGIQHLDDTFRGRPDGAREAHVMIVTDHDVFRMLEQGGKRDNWTVAREALAAAKGGGTYVLHMQPSWGGKPAERMKLDGWNVQFVLEWEDILAFARDFARRKWGRAEAAAR